VAWSETFWNSVNAEALLLDGKGCTKAEKHTEDKTFSASLAQFPLDMSAVKQDREEKPAENGEIEEAAQDEEKDGYFIHPVSTNETLVGIALKYRTTTSELRRINRLATDSQLFSKKSIYIPKTDAVQGPIIAPPSSEEKKQRVAVHSLKSQTGCSTEEAKWYLSDHDYNLEEALAQWKQDNTWEKKGGMAGDEGGPSVRVSKGEPSTPLLNINTNNGKEQDKASSPKGASSLFGLMNYFSGN